jgi:hypothetical protein
MIDRNETSFGIAGGVVAFGLIAILAFMTWALVYVAVPPANQNALTVLIGILSANVGVVVGFFYGTSVGNRKQAEALSTMAKTAQAAGVALSPAPDVTLKPGETTTV